ncbi:MAG: GvpL/GvpF family gas vesicle protein [Nocardioides sp.]
MPFHVYGVTSEEVALPDGMTGLYDAPVERVVDDGLAALVGSCPDQPVARRAELMAHARVLEALVEQETVLPMQFGMTMPDEDAVRRDLLAAHHDHLLGLLERLSGTVQLTVKAVYREEEALREVLRRSPRLLRTRERLASVPAAAAHFQQAEFGQEIAAEVERMGHQDAAWVLDQLVPRSLAYEEGRHVSAYHLLNTAFLVEREARTAFDAAVTDVSERLQERCTVRYLGPQPPYSFVDLQAGDPAWA